MIGLGPEEEEIDAASGVGVGVIRRGARGASVYAVLGGLQRGLPLLLLPLLIRSLTPEEYGQISLLVAITAVVGALLSLGLEPAVVRTIINIGANDGERRRFANTVGIFSIVIPLVGAAIACAVTLSLNPLASLQSPIALVAVAYLGMALQTTVTVFVGALLRAQERLRDYAVVIGVQTIGASTLSLLLVVGLHMGPLGWFAGTLIAAFGSLMVGLKVIDHRWSRELGGDYIRGILIFGIPLLPHTLAHWGLNLSDRLVLSGFVETREIGVYNLAYQLAAPIGLLAMAAHQGVMPLYAEAARNRNLHTELSRLATYQVHLTAFAGLAAALICPSLALFLFPKAYSGAAPLIPWIALGYVMFGFYLIPVDSISLMLGRTKWLWVPSTVAAVTNVALNLALVKTFGIIAAAVDTAIGYSVLLGGVIVYRRLTIGPRLRYELWPIASGLLVVAAAGALAMVLAPEPGDPAQAVVRSLLVAIAGSVLLLAHRSTWKPGSRGQSEVETVESELDQPTRGEKALTRVIRG